MLDIGQLIQEAKLGRTRKDAQIETCSVFAAALYDVLHAKGIHCSMACVSNPDGPAWFHSLVKVQETYFDSMGEFSTEIYRKRAKIHPRVTVALRYTRDSRSDCYEPEFEELYKYYRKALQKVMHN